MISLTSHAEEPLAVRDAASAATIREESESSPAPPKRDRMDEILDSINKKLEEMDKRKSSIAAETSSMMAINGVEETLKADTAAVPDPMADFVAAEEKAESAGDRVSNEPLMIRRKSSESGRSGGGIASLSPTKESSAASQVRWKIKALIKGS